MPNVIRSTDPRPITLSQLTEIAKDSRWDRLTLVLCFLTFSLQAFRDQSWVWFALSATSTLVSLVRLISVHRAVRTAERAAMQIADAVAKR